MSAGVDVLTPERITSAVKILAPDIDAVWGKQGRIVRSQSGFPFNRSGRDQRNEAENEVWPHGDFDMHPFRLYIDRMFSVCQSWSCEKAFSVFWSVCKKSLQQDWHQARLYTIFGPLVSPYLKPVIIRDGCSLHARQFYLRCRDTWAKRHARGARSCTALMYLVPNPGVTFCTLGHR